ncbi:protein archease-like [Hydra vulgaris]|uniref:Protein archease-like n=1 Tax=Hydra vulgaris TaxID=6087 RepID=A0ABM4B7G5_HYDVU
MESDSSDNYGYEYLDHPADIQIHSWGLTLKQAFEQQAIGMFGIMTDLNTIENLQEEVIEAEGHDLVSLLYKFLDECLFTFSVEPFLCAFDVNITEFDEEKFVIKAVLKGETFDLSKHPQGTEVKAITFSNMQINKESAHWECYVIFDI